MIVSFCGHSDFVQSEQSKQKVIGLLEEKIGENQVDFYLGGYGLFDNFAYICAKEYKLKHSNARLVFVTPYITPEYQKRELEYKQTIYDLIVYPNIEHVPLRFAIEYRNKYMMEKADLVISYVCREYGGAYKTYRYALKLGKKIFNIAKNKPQ